MIKILKEPLFQFLLIGAGLFFIYNLLNTKQDSEEITIDTSIVNELSAKYKLQWKREPGLKELESLIDAYVEQEVLYREALSMNLDHDDEIIKRRLAQKMEFLSDDLSSSLEPNEEALRSYYNTNKSNYSKPAIYTLKQVYFSLDKRDDTWADAKQALASEYPEKSGDRISLPSQYTNTSATRLGVDFGLSFAAAIDALPLQQWVGPIKSGLGVHLLLIEDKSDSGYYTFEEIQEKVSVDYNYEASNAFQEELISTMLEKYTIQIDVSDEQLQNVLREKF